MTSSADAVMTKPPTTPPGSQLAGEGSIWFFIIGDLIIFSVYFVFYTWHRGINQELFLESQLQLNQGIGFINTLILLTSSLFIALGAQSVHEGEYRRALALMRTAFFIGALFPVLKMVEWLPKINAGITPGENLFYLYYYIMTGLHLCHVLLGLVIQAFVLRHLASEKTPDAEFVDSGAVYWHMVDLLWIVVFAMFYLMR